MLNNLCFKQIFILVGLTLLIEITSSQQQTEQSSQSVAPILDIDDEKKGYVGTIGERNVLVDLKPHLQIKNIDQINGICSYHVFKPNNEEFPFTIDIKDKTTGEAVIEVLKKDLDSTSSSKLDDETEDQQLKNKENKYILLDCNKRKEFSFLIQAHDCSNPSLPSNKVPVRIEVLDHDDYPLKFESTEYKKKLATSNLVYEKIMLIRAKDNDCTNDGYACGYELVSSDDSLVLDESKSPFKIDSNGQLSTTQPLTKPQLFDFKVRAFDCLNKDSFVETPVHIEVVEPCYPKWNEIAKEIIPSSEQTVLFDQLKLVECDQLVDDLVQNQDSQCKIEHLNVNLKLELDSSIKNDCKKEDSCDGKQTETVESKLTLFSGKAEGTEESIEDDADESKDNEDDDLNDDENDDSSEDENKIPKTKPLNQPTNFKSFSKDIENAQKINFDGNFGDMFTLSVWLRRPASADQKIKEQVLCGTDSNSMNRHHFGLYFYRGNIKFLMRKESQPPASNLAQTNSETNEKFYPSLWQWALYEPVLSDSKWHFYEIKLTYPKASLFIDGKLFAENLTNSDIIDAYELKNTNDVEPLTTYIGACYHARTKTLVDHFEGDIGPMKLYKKKADQSKSTDPSCKSVCNEAIQMSGDEKASVKSINSNEIQIETSSLVELNEILSKINYANKNINKPQSGSRRVNLNTTIKCSEDGRQVNLNVITVDVNVKAPKKDYIVQLKTDQVISVLKSQVESGIKPFSKISIDKSLKDESEDDDSESDEQDDLIDLANCQIHILPELISNKDLSEKIIYDTALLDQFKLEFNDSSNLIIISGLQKMKNYELFIQSLTYQLSEITLNGASTSNYEKTKTFHLSCARNEPSIETNTIIIQLNISTVQQIKIDHPPYSAGKYAAYKQQNRLFASDNDDEIIQRKDYKLNNSNEMSTPLIIALIVMCSCAMGFLLIFGAMRLRSAGFFGNRKKNLINEENPQMEWDDSGLNITENPLDNFDVSKKYSHEGAMHSELEDDEEYSSYDEHEGEEDDDDDDDREDHEGEDYEDYSSDEDEQEKIVERDLEWDDTSIEIKDKHKISSNKRVSSNDFV